MKWYFQYLLPQKYDSLSSTLVFFIIIICNFFVQLLELLSIKREFITIYVTLLPFYIDLCWNQCFSMNKVWNTRQRLLSSICVEPQGLLSTVCRYLNTLFTPFLLLISTDLPSVWTHLYFPAPQWGSRWVQRGLCTIIRTCSCCETGFSEGVVGQGKDAWGYSTSTSYQLSHVTCILCTM